MSQRVTESVCGITEFNTPTNRNFTGTIKEVPEDFVVVELDPLGNAVDDAQYTLPSDQEEEQEEKETRSAVDGALTVEKPLEAVRTLDVLLNATLRARLDGLAERVKLNLQRQQRDHEHDGNATSAINEEQEEFSLGIYPLKEERRLMHNWVCWLHPMLHIRSGGGGNENPNELVVHSNPDYGFFFRLLGERAADSIVRSSVHGIQAKDWSLVHESRSTSSPSRFMMRVVDPPTNCCTTFSESATKDDRRALHDKLRAKYRSVQCRVKDGVVQLLFTKQASREKTNEQTSATDKRNSNSSFKNQNRNQTDSIPAPEDSVGPPVYTHLVVKKRDVDLFDLYEALSAFFKVARTAVCIAGIKDKCAVTWQRCSVPGDHSRMLRRFAKQQNNSHSNSDGKGESSRLACVVQVGSLWIVSHRVLKKPIRLGELSGNRFKITIRNLHVHLATDAEIPEKTPPVPSVQLLRERLSDVEKNGFLNYFGTQRFGMVMSVEMHTGVHVIAGRWSDAVRSLLAHADPEVFDGLPHSLRSVQNAPEKRRRSESVFESLLSSHENNISDEVDDMSGGLNTDTNENNEDGEDGESEGVAEQEKQQQQQRSGKGGKDASLVFHALRFAYLRHPSRDALTHDDDVVNASAAWESLCHEALQRVPFSLRALWVHAAQSVVFNKLLSAVARSVQQHQGEEEEEVDSNGSERNTKEGTGKISSIPSYLPLLGYRVSLMRTNEKDSGCTVKDDTSSQTGATPTTELPSSSSFLAATSDSRSDEVRDLGEEGAKDKSHNEIRFSPTDLEFLQDQLETVLKALKLRHEDFTSTSKVFGVPLRGSWRRCVVQPEQVHLAVVGKPTTHPSPSTITRERTVASIQNVDDDDDNCIASVQFSLPPSSYATVCLRELLGGQGEN